MTEFDNSDAAAAIGAGATVTVRTINGYGTADVALVGDGNSNVDMKYSVDGGADTTIKASDVPAVISLGFTTSLAIKAVNNDGALPHNRSSVSTTGLKR